MGKRGSGRGRRRCAAREVQIRAAVRPHEGEAVAAGSHQGRDVPQHAPFGGPVLDDLGLEVRVRLGSFHLYPRNGSRAGAATLRDRKSTRLNSSHTVTSYAVFCLKNKKTSHPETIRK